MKYFVTTEYSICGSYKRTSSCMIDSRFQSRNDNWRVLPVPVSASTFPAAFAGLHRLFATNTTRILAVPQDHCFRLQHPFHPLSCTDSAKQDILVCADKQCIFVTKLTNVLPTKLNDTIEIVSHPVYQLTHSNWWNLDDHWHMTCQGVGSRLSSALNTSVKYLSPFTDCENIMLSCLKIKSYVKLPYVKT